MHIGSRAIGQTRGGCGAVVPLSVGPKRCRSVRLNGGTVDFAPGWAHADVLLTERVDAFDEIRDRCHDLLQQAIDVRFVRDGGPSVAVDGARPVVVWQNDQGGIELTLMETASQGVLVEASWEHRRDDTVIGRSEDLADPEWHESFRFRRIASTAQDVFDAYRNTYLALEAILSSALPRGREREVDWLERALAALDGQFGLDLAAFEVGGPTPALWVQGQYEAFRCALFHAKADGRGRWMPGDRDATARVSAALMSLEPLVRLLSGKLHGADTGIGVMTHQGMLLAARVTAAEGFELGRTTDTAEADAGDTALSPAGLECAWHKGEWTGEAHGRPDTFRYQAEADLLSSDPVNVIGRVGMRVAGRVLMTVSSVDQLGLDRVRRYRHVIDWSWWNRGFHIDPFA